MTPLSDAALEAFPEFVNQVRGRLERGKRDYGDASFERPLPQLIEELRQEALDLCGWSFVVWARLENLQQLAEEATSVHRRTADGPVVHDGQVVSARPARVMMGWPGEVCAEIGVVPD